MSGRAFLVCTVAWMYAAWLWMVQRLELVNVLTRVIRALIMSVYSTAAAYESMFASSL